MNNIDFNNDGKLSVFNDMEFFIIETEKKEVNITPFHCLPCDKYLSTASNLRNHNETSSHSKKLERIKILKKAEESNDLICLIPIKNNDGDIIAHTMVDTKVYTLIMNYAICITNGYATITINNDKHRLNRYIYYNLRKIEPNPMMKIDHKNRDKLDNTIKNLQEATISDNNRNREKGGNLTSKYYGVHKNKNYWVCSLSFNGEKNDFYYKNELHAAYHYNLLVKEFGKENFVH